MLLLSYLELKLYFHVNIFSPFLLSALPISNLEPVVLQEGRPYGVVATCRAAGHPLPRLSWDTELPGQSQNRTNTEDSVTSTFSLYPLRSMNGKKLDCLVWHPGLEGPHRIPHLLEVQCE